MSSASGVSTSLMQDKDTAFKRIAVLPFQYLSQDEALQNAVAITVPATVIKSQSDPETPQRIIQDLFWDGLAVHKKYDLVSPIAREASMNRCSIRRSK